MCFIVIFIVIIPSVNGASVLIKFKHISVQSIHFFSMTKLYESIAS